MKMLKLFIVVRADIDVGLQLAQVVHATAQFVHYNPEEHRDWFYGPEGSVDRKQWQPANSNVVVKHVSSEAELLALVKKAAPKSMGLASFQEPDLNNETTAAAFCGAGAQQLLWHLPLAFAPRVAAA